MMISIGSFFDMIFFLFKSDAISKLFSPFDASGGWESSGDAQKILAMQERGDREKWSKSGSYRKNASPAGRE